MVICHQPYSEIMEIPVETSAKLMKSFGKWTEKLFGKGGGNPNQLIAEIDYEAIMNNAG